MELPPERWSKFLPAKFRDAAPRTVPHPQGGDGLVVGDSKPEPIGLSITGVSYEEHKIAGVSFSGAPGGGTPERRLEEQDIDGIDAEVLFFSPTMMRVWMSIPDPDAYKAMFRAYNDFLGQEYCLNAPDRLIGMGLIPNATVDDACEELLYCAELGLKGVVMQAFPNGSSHALPEDDRFWEAAVSTKMGITCHSSLDRFKKPGEPVFVYDYKPNQTGGGAGEPVAHLTRFTPTHIRNPSQLIFSGVFDRFPELAFYFAETQVGWLPYSLEQMDDTYERGKYWAKSDFGLEPLDRMPSEYVREHFYWGFLSDPIGARMEDQVGGTRAIWGSDFPHLSGDYPYSNRVIENNFKGVSEEGKQLMLAGNAAKFFHLDE